MASRSFRTFPGLGVDLLRSLQIRGAAGGRGPRVRREAVRRRAACGSRRYTIAKMVPFAFRRGIGRHERRLAVSSIKPEVQEFVPDRRDVASGLTCYPSSSTHATRVADGQADTSRTTATPL